MLSKKSTPSFLKDIPYKKKYDMGKVINQLHLAHFSYETDFYTKAPTRAIENHLINSIAKGKKILDVGCGPGRVTSAFKKAGHNVTGVDLVPRCLEAAKKNFPDLNLDIHLGDMCDLPFANESFDEVLCLSFAFNGLAAQNDRIKALKEMARVCSPGGRILIENFNYLNLSKFGIIFLSNMLDELSRILRSLAIPHAPRLPFGDILYLPSKSDNAAPGYAHLPTPFELFKLCRKAWDNVDYRLLSAHQLEKDKRLFPISYIFNYSMWIEGKKFR